MCVRARGRRLPVCGARVRGGAERLRGLGARCMRYASRTHVQGRARVVCVCCARGVCVGVRGGVRVRGHRRVSIAV